LREKDNHFLVDGYTIHGFINKEGRPKRPPKFLVNAIDLLISD